MSTRRGSLVPRLAVTVALVLGGAAAATAPAAAAGAVGAPAAVATDATLDDAAAALSGGESVYVAPESASQVSSAQADQLRAQIRDAGYPFFIAVLPKSSAVGGSSAATLTALHDKMQLNGTYAVWLGDQSSSAFRAGDTTIKGLVANAATVAYQQNKDAGAYATISAFLAAAVPIVTGAGSGAGTGTGGDVATTSGSGGGVFLAVLAVGVLVVAVVGLVGYRRSRTVNAARTAEVKATVFEDVTAYGEAVARLDVDDPRLDDAGRADAQRALDAYETAKVSADRMVRPEDATLVTSALEDGRFALACVEARIAGVPLPERRPPCFVDPRHGPSVRDVTWAPDGGAPRPVPVCQACAVTLESGRLPIPRQVQMAGQSVPYWAAGRQYAPYAGGYYASSGADIMTMLFVGSMLGGVFNHPTYVDNSVTTMGGGGDFGGGGFGGGDFGGGDFGGGGDF